MAIKAGQILHVANQFVVDRIQTGGAGALNIPQEKVHELGNYQSVGIVRDVPDLTFSLECLDVDTEVEALLTGSTDPLADPTSTVYELSKNKPIDITSPWKTPYGEFTAVHGVAVPQLFLESASYRYGLAENAGETFSLRGDSIFYVPGAPYQDVATAGTTRTVTINTTSTSTAITGPAGTFSTTEDVGAAISGPGIPSGATLAAVASDTSATLSAAATATASGVTATITRTAVSRTYNFSNGPALVYREGGVTRYALSVSVDGQRLVRGTDYTDTATGITLTDSPTAGARVSIVYGSATGASFPQAGQDPYGTGNTHLVHQGVSVKPAAIRGKDIDVFFSTAIPGVDLGAGVGAPVEIRWPDVQSATVDWSVTLEEDREFGNAYAVSREATDIPTVSGAIEIKPRSVAAFYTRLRQITGISDLAQIMGPQSSLTGALRIEIRNPESGGSTAVATGTVLKTHYIPAARFTMPGYTGTVQQKLTTTLNYESDDGVLKTYKGPRA